MHEAASKLLVSDRFHICTYQSVCKACRRRCQEVSLAALAKVLAGHGAKGLGGELCDIITYQPVCMVNGKTSESNIQYGRRNKRATRYFCFRVTTSNKD